MVGGEKFPLRLRESELLAFGSAIERLAKQKNAGVILLSSPRSPKDCLTIVSQRVTQPKWTPSSGQANAYGAALTKGDLFCVTSDSVSMVAEMLGMQKPVFVFQLPQSKFAVHWNSDEGLPATLARNGILSPPRNTAGLMQDLINQGLVSDLTREGEVASPPDVHSLYDAAVSRVRSLVGL